MRHLSFDCKTPNCNWCKTNFRTLSNPQFHHNINCLKNPKNSNIDNINNNAQVKHSISTQVNKKRIINQVIEKNDTSYVQDEQSSDVEDTLEINAVYESNCMDQSLLKDYYYESDEEIYHVNSFNHEFSFQEDLSNDYFYYQNQNQVYQNNHYFIAYEDQYSNYDNVNYEMYNNNFHYINGYFMDYNHSDDYNESYDDSYYYDNSDYDSYYSDTFSELNFDINDNNDNEYVNNNEYVCIEEQDQYYYSEEYDNNDVFMITVTDFYINHMTLILIYVKNILFKSFLISI